MGVQMGKPEPHQQGGLISCSLRLSCSILSFPITPWHSILPGAQAKSLDSSFPPNLHPVLQEILMVLPLKDIQNLTILTPSMLFPSFLKEPPIWAPASTLDPHSSF